MKRNDIWRECYVHAVLETNPDLKFVQIYEAISAIEQRRLSPVESDEERRELANAEEGIRALIAEVGSQNVVTDPAWIFERDHADPAVQP